MRHPHVIPWGNVQPGDSDTDPDDNLYDNLILAEGDSWFSMGGIPTSNLLFNLKFNGFVVVVNCARPGDTIRRVGKIAKNPNLKKAMSRRDGYAWDARRECRGDVLTTICAGAGAPEMFVQVRWSERDFAVPLSQLYPIEPDVQSQEAIEDWHYWVARNYIF